MIKESCYLLTIISILILFVQCRKQHNIEPKENEHFINLECLIRQQSSHKANYIKYAQNELGIKENRWIHYYYRKQINLNKLEELKTIGIDILKESHDFWGKNYIRNSLNLSTIIEGRIESKLQREKEYNVYEVSINQIIHNDYLWKGANKVYVKASIPRLSSSQIYNIKEGEDILLFLDPFKPNQYMANDLETREERIDGILKNIGLEFRDTFLVKANYILKENKYLYNSNLSKIGTKKEIYSKIKTVKKINNFRDFVEDFM